jgi:hypothetical protein
LKALELRIDRKSYKLQNLKYEQLENNCYQFGLKALGLISIGYPTEVSLYSYEKETTLLTETIIVLPNLDIQFNKSLYYGDIERKVVITNDKESEKLSWTNRDSEITCPLNEGILVIKVPYFRWRINNNDWHNEPFNRKLWYKGFLQNGDLLEIDNPKEDEEISILCKIDGKSFEISKNQIGKFEIGQTIYANEGEIDIFVYFFNAREKFELLLFNIATKEHFIDNPLTYINGKVLWDVKNTFIGEKNNEFFLIAKANSKTEKSVRKKLDSTNIELDNFNEDVYAIIVKIRDKNIFSKGEKYDFIFEGELSAGNPENLRFKNKKIKLLSAKCFNAKSDWISFIPKYFIDTLKFVQEEENTYYKGQLCVIDRSGETRVLNTMENEKGKYDKINPVRIELRDNSTLWLVAGWQGGNDFIGNLFCDKKRRGICNIAQKNNLYDEINLYKFKEEENV